MSEQTETKIFVYVGIQEDSKDKLHQTYVEIEPAHLEDWEDQQIIDYCNLKITDHNTVWFSKYLIKGTAEGAIISVQTKRNEDGGITVLGEGRKFVRLLNGGVMEWYGQTRAIRQARAAKAKAKKQMRMDQDLDGLLEPVARAYKKLNRAEKRALLILVMDAIQNNKNVR